MTGDAFRDSEYLNKLPKYCIFEYLSIQTMRKIISLIFLCALCQVAYPQWILLSDDFEPNISITAYDSIVIAGAVSYGTYTLAVSYDDGNTWIGNNLLSSDQVQYLYTAADSMIYACTPTEVFRTAKDTINWFPYNEGLPAAPINKICMKDSIMLASSTFNLYKRIAGDTAWTIICDSIPTVGIVDFDYDGNLIVLAGKGIAESYDMGSTWTMWNDNGEIAEWDAVTIKGDTIIAASKGGIWRKLISSGDESEVSEGLHKLWTPTGEDYYGEFEMFHHIGNNIFVCGESGVYKLSGNTWYWESIDLEFTDALADNGEILFAAAYNGIWSRPLNQLIVNTNEDAVLISPINIYPNPASDHIIVRSDKIIRELSIYDHLGRIMYKADPGKSFINLELFDYKPGIYLVCCKTKDDLYVKKIIINLY